MYGYGNSMILATHGILARSGGGGGVDPDAQAFITAAAITNPTQQAAINTLVVSLKGYNVWSKMKALYPFVGGTATTHKFNLKNPLDTDAAFRIFWNGGVTHSSNGVQFGGVNGWGNTYLNPPTKLSGTSNHVSFYSRTNNAASSAIEMGVIDTNYYFHLHCYHPGNLMYSLLNTNTVTGYNNANSLGHFIGTRTGVTASQGFKNGSSLGTNTNAVAIGTTVNFLILGASNTLAGTPTNYTNRECAFASIGDGLTPTEAANFYTAVQTFQTTLNRNV